MLTFKSPPRFINDLVLFRVRASVYNNKVSTKYLCRLLGAKVLLWAMFSFPISAQALRLVTEDLPPLQMSHQQKLADGAMIDVIKLLLEETQLSGKIEFYPWARSYQIALTEPNVLIFSMLRDDSREHKFHWIGELYAIRSYLVSLNHRKDIIIDQLSDAKNYTVATVRQDLAEQYLLDNGFQPDKNLYITSGYQVLWKMLYSERADVAFTNSLIWRHEIENIGLAPNKIKFVHQVTDIASNLYLAASLQTDPKIVAKLSQALSAIKADGRYQKILDKWQL